MGEKLIVMAPVVSWSKPRIFFRCVIIEIDCVATGWLSKR